MSNAVKIRVHKLNSPSDEEENIQVNQEHEYLIIIQSEFRSEIEKVLPEVLAELLKIIKAHRKES